MQFFLQQFLSGLASGAIYASLALALVMIYQTIEHINFAQGEMATFSTYIAWSLLAADWPYWLAFGLTVVASFMGGGVIERLLFAPIRTAPAISHIIVFLGLFLLFHNGVGWIWDFTVKPFPSPFPQASFYGLISLHEVGMIGIILFLLVLLYAFFRFTRLGLAVRAVAQNPQAACLMGIRVDWVRALGWGMASALGAVAGMLIAPIVFLEPNMMVGVLIYAFAGAVVGGLSSLGGAVIGGFLVGVLENLAGAYISAELKLSLALLLIFLVLLIKPQGLMGQVTPLRV